MRFEFATAGRILFGEGALAEVAPAARQMGSRVLLVAGCPAFLVERLEGELHRAGLAVERFPVAAEPTLDLVRAGVAQARAAGCDVMISLGGGSAVDAGKAIAALLANGGDPLDYLEVIGAGRPLRVPSAPFIAVPTTAGTGAEVTRNAVLASAEHRVKASLRSPLMLPRLAVVDPELTYELPPALTAATGLDALTQLIEPYVSTRANPMTDVFCLEGVRLVAGALERAWRNGQDGDARRDMALASLFGGLALANAGLGAVHGFAAAIGGRFDAPHGAVCAALLAHVIEANLRVIRERDASHPALGRYRVIAQVLTGRAEARPEEGAEWIRQLCARLDIPRLSAYGVGQQHAAELVEAAARASSMKANPVALTPEDLRGILLAAL